MIYLDTSAAVKALVLEDGSDSVRARFAAGQVFVSSRLLAVELHAVVDRRTLLRSMAEQVLARVHLVALDDATAGRAIDLHSGLRTLDALHLAAALDLGDAITGILSFDQDMIRVAAAHGLAAA